MKLLLQLFFIVALAFFICFSSVSAGEIYEPSPKSFLSFQKYQVIASSEQNGILTRKFIVYVKNTSAEMLYDVSILIDSAPNFVMHDGIEMNLGDIPPGEIKGASTPTELSIDTIEQNGEDVRLIWRIGCTIDGDQVLDETAVIENL